jgi:hypothetical protein
MGLDGYYRIFIEVFSKGTHLITSLQNKGTKFEWTAKCEKSFQQLKELLTGAPILKVGDLDENFVVCIDACKEGIGGILTQNAHVICYDSRNLKEHERNYSTYGLDLESIVHAKKCGGIISWEESSS